MKPWLLCVFAFNLSTAQTALLEANMNLESKNPSMFTEVLSARQPSPELGAAAEVYGWLIGSWNVRVFDIDSDGRRHETRGEWHFSWALEGRAVQDVFIVPVREARTPQTPKEGNRYGTTLRVFDPEIHAWRVTWTNPVRHVENRLIGTKVGNEIVQEGVNQDGARIRWCFRDIQPNSFRWTGEESKDNGKTWHLGAEFFAERK